ncbi:hypothetical protein LZ30DRAFT_692847 [Colletotrichum cereale]|nr:hypothetical protein LZ30DRAFT_692847 [Colletotrichum cereale]
MKLLVTVAHVAAVVLCLPSPVTPNAKAVAAPVPNAPAFLQARDPDPRQELYKQPGGNTWGEFKDGVNLIKPNTPSEPRARKDQQVWENSQKRVKEKTGCDYLGFLVGEVGKAGGLTGKLLFKAQLHYVVPVSSPSGTHKGAKWQRRTLEGRTLKGNKIPGNLHLKLITF